MICTESSSNEHEKHVNAGLRNDEDAGLVVVASADVRDHVVEVQDVMLVHAANAHRVDGGREDDRRLPAQHEAPPRTCNTETLKLCACIACGSGPNFGIN